MDCQNTSPEQPDLSPADAVKRGCPVCKRPPKKKVTKAEWALLAFLGLIFTLAVSTSKIKEYVASEQRDLIKSDMVALAGQGKPDAYLWVMQYVPEMRSPNDVERLKAFAEQGHPESMYRYSNYLHYKKDEDASLAMLQKAADAGNPSAVMALYERKHP
jgi:TPR repeat protein